MTKNTIACSPSIYKDVLSPNTIDLNNSYKDVFDTNIQIYKRGNFHPNSVVLQKVLLGLYGLNQNQIGQIAIASSGVSIAIAIAQSKIFNHILYDASIYPEMIEAFSIHGNAIEFKSFSQIQANDLICIESYSLPSCTCNYKKIELLVEYAHSKGAYVFVDNSCMTPYVWNPLSINVDLCGESLAKNTNGYNTSLIGSLVVNPASQINRLAINELLDSFRFFGFYPHPFDCYLTILGIQTLPLRMEQIKNTSQKINQYLKTFTNIKFNAIEDVGLFFIKISNKFDILQLNKCHIFQSAGVFGTNFSVIDKMEKLPYLRISIGLEDFADLQPDLDIICNFISLQ